MEPLEHSSSQTHSSSGQLFPYVDIDPVNELAKSVFETSFVEDPIGWAVDYAFVILIDTPLYLLEMITSLFFEILGITPPNPPINSDDKTLSELTTQFSTAHKARLEMIEKSGDYFPKDTDKYLSIMANMYLGICNHIEIFDELLSPKDFVISAKQKKCLENLKKKNEELKVKFGEKLKKKGERISSFLKNECSSYKDLEEVPLSDLKTFISYYDCVQATQPKLLTIDKKRIDEIKAHIKKKEAVIFGVAAPQPLGLGNIGNSCYMAAALQALLAVKEVRDRLKTPIKKPEKFNKPEDELAFSDQLAIQKALIPLIEALEKHNQDAILGLFAQFREAVFHNSMLCQDLSVMEKQKDADGNIILIEDTDSYELQMQHDSAQLMMLLLDMVGLNVTQKLSWSVEHLGDTVFSKDIIRTLDPIIDIPLNGAKDLQTLINENFAIKERNDSDNRRKMDEIKYKTFAKWKEYTELEHPPEVLVLRLKRFEMQEDGMLKRNGSVVNFPDNLQIDMEPAFHEKADYELRSCVVHEGSLGGGHYYAQAKYGRWYKYNDNHISLPDRPVHEGKNLFNYGNPARNYLLVFRRIDR